MIEGVRSAHAAPCEDAAVSQQQLRRKPSVRSLLVHVDPREGAAPDISAVVVVIKAECSFVVCSLVSRHAKKGCWYLRRSSVKAECTFVVRCCSLNLINKYM